MSETAPGNPVNPAQMQEAQVHDMAALQQEAINRDEQETRAARAIAALHIVERTDSVDLRGRVGHLVQQANTESEAKFGLNEDPQPGESRFSVVTRDQEVANMAKSAFLGAESDVARSSGFAGHSLERSRSSKSRLTPDRRLTSAARINSRRNYKIKNATEKSLQGKADRAMEKADEASEQVAA